MLYELYDSDNPLAIPVGVKAAGYDDGYAANAWAVYGWARFPDALHISVFGNPESDVDDVESGGDTPADTPNYAAGRKARGKVAIIYVNRSNGHLVEQYLRGAGFTQSEVMLWIGTDDGTQVVTHWIDGTPVYYPVWAVQYLNEAHGSGGHYDRSLVYLAFGGGGSTITGNKRRVKVVATSDGYLAFGIGDNDVLYAYRYDGSPGPAWTLVSLGGAWLDFDVTGGGQRIDIYGRGRDDRHAYHVWSDDAGKTFSQIELLGTPPGTFKSPLLAIGPGSATSTPPEPPEPPEPKTITLDIPSVPGKATGTIS